MQSFTVRPHFAQLIFASLTLLAFMCGSILPDHALLKELNLVSPAISAESTSTTLLPKQTVWSSIQAGLTLNHKLQAPEVQKQIKEILANKAKFNSILQAAGPYIYYIHQQTELRHLPSELALIPVIESEFNPHDHSSKGASGLWQLMPQTAHDLKIKVLPGYDGRRNVVESTNGALMYFNDLRKEFKDDWYLAIAAYNCGDGKVRSAQRHHSGDNVWKFSLPKETKLYVAKLLAVAEIVKNPQKYGVVLPVITNQPYFAEFKIKKPVSLKVIAQSTGISVDSLEVLNPDYTLGKLSRFSSILLVPASNAFAVRNALADIII